MDNTLLYFFSTISQVLAALIALVFVFVIFKLQDFDKAINVLCIDFASILGNNVTEAFNWQRLGTSGEFMTNYKSMYFNGIANLMNKICEERANDNKHAVEQLKKVAHKTEIVEQKRQNIIDNVKQICILGFSLIVCSILAIPFVKIVANNYLLMIILIVGFIFLISLTLLWIYKLLSISLKR